MEKKIKDNQLRQELSGCLFILEIMGLQYFSLKSLSKESAQQKVSTSRLVLMIALILVMTMFVIGSTLSEPVNIVTNLTAKTLITLLIQKMFSICLVLIVFTSIIESFVKTKCIQKLFLNSETIVSIVHKEFNIRIDFGSIRKAVWIKISTLTTFLVILHGVYLFSSYDLTPLNRMFVRAISIIPLFFLLMVTFKFIFYVDMVNNQLIFIEKFTKNFNKLQKTPENVHLIRLTSVQRQESDDSFKQLHAIWKVYNLIYNNGVLVNDSHGLTVLLTFVTIVVACTILGYEVFIIMVSTSLQGKIPGIAYSIIVALVILTSLVAYCQKTQGIVSNIKTFDN